MQRHDDWFSEDGPVYRTLPLPRGEIRGLFLVASSVFRATQSALRSFRAGDTKDDGHEGIVYWAGRELGDCTVFVQAIVPVADHGPQHVMVSGEEIGRVQRAGRQSRLGILCQVHSHPGLDTRHSDGDDDLVLLPFEGMLSLVAPRYGFALDRIADFSVHQYQDGRWVLCSPESVRRQLVYVPELQDLR
jgi:proteasome lid subunit RPN8/RPN11